MEIAIREARRRDSSIILQLIAELATTAGETSPVTTGYVEKYLSSPISRVLLAEAGGEVIGLLSYSIRPDLYHGANTGLIEEVIVREAMRSKGVGSALVNELFSRLAALGCVEVSVTVMPGNTQAIKFYRAHGLTEEALFLERHFGL